MLLWVGVGAMFFAYSSGWIGNNFAFMLLVLVLAFVCNLVLNQESILYVPEIQGVRHNLQTWSHENIVSLRSNSRNVCPAGMKTCDQNPFGYRSPDQQGLKFEERFLAVPGEDGLELHAWFIPAAKDPTRAVTVLFCHGTGFLPLQLVLRMP